MRRNFQLPRRGGEVGRCCGWLTATCAVAWAAPTNDHFAPLGNEFLVNASTSYNQYWPRTDLAIDGSRIFFAFASGQDPAARQFLVDGTPATGNLTCNPTLNQHVQDEPETAASTDGFQLVAWSERYGYDGEIMGIFGRIFMPGGAPLAAEFQINQIWQASQWRPLIARRPNGGWVVAWSGDWDGDALFRLVNSDGSFQTGDIRVNTFDNGAQVDTAPAVAPDGTMMLVFVDFSGWAGVGSGTNLWARLYDGQGNPLQAAPFPLNTPGFPTGDQREPRVAADGQGRFIVVWEDQVHDGSGYGIFGRRFDPTGTPLGPEFQINTTSIGSQRGPKVAADAAGNFVVAWEDWSTGDADVRAQRFDSAGQPIGAEFIVNTVTAGNQRSVGIATTPNTGHVVITFEGPGIQTDVYARVFTTYEAPHAYCTAKINSLGCSPEVEWSGAPTLSGPDDFEIRAVQILNQKTGLMFWGMQSSASPFHGGTLCVQTPVVRTPMQISGGTLGGPDCSGTYSFAMTQAYMTAKGLRSGDTVHAQYWSRDPGFPGLQGVSLTNGLQFDVRP